MLDINVIKVFNSANATFSDSCFPFVSRRGWPCFKLYAIAPLVTLPSLQWNSSFLPNLNIFSLAPFTL
jgi:hypothetical protein